MERAAAELFQRQGEYGLTFGIGTQFSQLQRERRSAVRHGIMERQFPIAGERERSRPYGKLRTDSSVGRRQSEKIAERGFHLPLRCLQPAGSRIWRQRKRKIHGVGLEFFHPNRCGAEHHVHALRVWRTHVQPVPSG